MSNVAIIRCENYEQELVDKAIEEVCRLAGMPEVTGKRILLKPNILSDAKEDRSITTHSQILRSMIRLLKHNGAKEILVGDSPGLQKPNFQPKASGIYQVCKDEGVRWVDFTKQPKTYTIPYSYNKRLPLAAVLSEVDMVFSLPKCKTHQLMYATGAVKNLFGLVPN
ncbi:MAG: DUF362 domain-containing protein, partial [Sphaerochaetaceae bacterium]